MARADKSALISSIVTVFQRGEFVYYSAVVAHFGVNPTSILKRIRGFTKTCQEANSFYCQYLTNNQEVVLISQINILIDRGIPLTSYIVKNLAKEIKG